MHDILIQLEADHYRMIHHLFLLDAEIESFCRIKLKLTNSDKILELLDYIQHFPCEWHHPSEDILFTMLLEKPGINQISVRTLLDDHSRLESLSCEVLNIFTELKLHPAESTPQILRISKRYYSQQVSHIHAERNIFQLIDKLFAADDWQRASRLIQQRCNSSVQAIAM
ncbi:MAG: hemerythrin domain-containing protein [Spongiibacteraceae bacterium]